jgi:UDP-glucose 4-epimerase
MNISASFAKSDSVLIVGGTGFLGRHLVERCIRDTDLVSCIGLTAYKTGLFSKDIEFLQADITNLDRLKAVLSGRRFNYVFNLGGYINHIPYFKGGREVIEAHLIGLLNLLDCLDREDLKGFVQIGSSDEYGGALAPQNELMRELPISPYSFSKVAASHFIQMLSTTEGFPGVTLRLFLVYGPGQDEKRFLPQIIKGCLSNSEFKTSEGKQLRDFCYVDDATEAMVRAAILPGAKGHVINVASGVPISIRDMISKVMEITKGGRPLWGEHPYRKGENMALYAETSLAERLLEWKYQVSLDEGLERTVEYFRKTLDKINQG